MAAGCADGGNYYVRYQDWHLVCPHAKTQPPYFMTWTSSRVSKVCGCSIRVADIRDMGSVDRHVSNQRFDPLSGTTKAPHAFLKNLTNAKFYL
jgi:hypothetical protein